MKKTFKTSHKAIFNLMIIVVFAMLVSCQGEDGKTDVNGGTEVSLVQVDSIMIDLKGDLKIYDYNETTGLFLGGDIGSLGMAMMPPGGPVSFNEIGHVVIQKDGKVLHQFKHFDDGPEGHGTGALNSFFIGNDKIGVMGNKGLFVYALDGTFLKKYKDFNTTMFLGMPEHKVAVTNAEGMMAIAFPRREDDTYDRFDSVYQLVKNHTLKQKLKLIDSFQTTHKNLLDYGCGTGDFLNVCKKKGWNILGIEPSIDAINIAAQKGVYTNNWEVAIVF